MKKNQPFIELLIEAILMASEQPMSLTQLANTLEKNEHQPIKISNQDLKKALESIQKHHEDRSFGLVEVASGYQFQVDSAYAEWIVGMQAEKPSKYSKALLETLALIAYRQPITRGEIEEIRGVSISSSIFKTIHEEREWVRIVGHRDVPGKPGLYGTTKAFLDYFGLRGLDQLPALPEIEKIIQEKEAKPAQVEMHLAQDEESTETSEA